ncbi:hypothetical protein RSAG8_04709, partial [Rhizoctonia solani AG-8 WAC10335]
MPKSMKNLTDPEYGPPGRRSTIHEDESDDELHLSRQPQSSRIEPNDNIPKGAKLKKPEPFNGKRGAEAETFLMKMQMYFNDYQNAFTDERKIIATLSNMGEGEPSRWAKPLLHKLMDKETHEYLTTWNSFKKAFLLNFSDPLKKDKAIRDINKLKRTGSAQIYASHFRTLKEDLDWDEKALTDKFREGLKTDVQKELMRMKITTPNMDQLSLEEIIEIAIRTDDILFQSRGLGSHIPGITIPGKNTGRREPNKDKEGWIPTDVIQKRKEEKRCLKCGKPDHLIRQCKEKKFLPEPIKGKAAAVDEEEDTKTYYSRKEHRKKGAK